MTSGRRRTQGALAVARRWLPGICGLLVGVLVGLAAFTFVYANGMSYLGHDPKACASCHVMQDYYDAYTAGLIDFVTASPSSYHAAAEAARRLGAVGFRRVEETAAWGRDLPGRGCVVRDGALIAWMLPERPTGRTGVRIVGAHTDSPALKLKPSAALSGCGYQLINAEVYGGPLLNSFLDRELGLAGRLVTRDGAVHLVRTGPIARVAQVAPHLDRGVNDSLRLDRQAHLLPLWSLIDDAVAGARAAAEAGLLPVKVNAVLVRGVNDAQAVRLVAEALASGYELRFIEQMPLGPSGQWTRSGMVAAEEILSRLEGAFKLVARPGTERGSSPAELWDVAPGKVDGVEHPGGTVGVIASITRPFCGDCDRTRLTADGQVRSCLFAREETDLRSLLRAGADDDTIADAWRAAMWGKQPGHGVDDPSFLQPSRTMSAIGG